MYTIHEWIEGALTQDVCNYLMYPYHMQKRYIMTTVFLWCWLKFCVIAIASCVYYYHDICMVSHDQSRHASNVRTIHTALKYCLYDSLNHIRQGCFIVAGAVICLSCWDPVYEHGLTVILAWISNYIHYKIWNEVTYLFANFNGATV